jgi:hypothetical protein
MEEPTPSNPAASAPPPVAPPPPPAPAPAPAPASPPAAETVSKGAETEEVSTLRDTLQQEKDARKKTELRNMELEDENHRLRSVPKAPRAPARKKASSFGFFREEED